MSAMKRGVVAAIAATFAWVAAGVANAEPVDDTSVSHIYIDDEYEFAESAPVSTSASTPEGNLGPSRGYDIDPSLLPSEGETTIVHYTNATETIVAPTATCTHSVTASTPYMTGNAVVGKVNLKRSSGCSGTWQGNGQTNFKNLIGLWQTGGTSATVSNLGAGANVTKQWSNICKGNRSTTWVTLGAMWYQSQEATSSSNQVTLSCTR